MKQNKTKLKIEAGDAAIILLTIGTIIVYLLSV